MSALKGLSYVVLRDLYLNQTVVVSLSPMTYDLYMPWQEHS